MSYDVRCVHFRDGAALGKCRPSRASTPGRAQAHELGHCDGALLSACERRRAGRQTKLLDMRQPLEPIGAALASGMPCDEDRLAEVGRVHWAAARLHAGVRDAINFIDRAPSDALFRDWTLGSAITQLEQRAQKFVDGPDQDALIRWCRDVGRPAKHHRDAVAHAITYTATDGR